MSTKSMYNVLLRTAVIEEVPGMCTKFIISDSAGRIGVCVVVGGAGGPPVGDAPAVYNNMLSAACHLLLQT